MSVKELNPGVHESVVGRNMSKIGIFILTALISNVTLAQESATNISTVEKFFHRRCKAYSTDAAVYDDIKAHFNQFSDYLTYAAILLPNGKEQFCEDEKPKLSELARNLAIESTKCMAKREKYLPNFFYESFASFLNFVCKGRNIEGFFSSQGAECRAALKQNNAGASVGNCFKKLFARFNDLVEKDDLCLDLKSAKRCFASALRDNCQDFAAFESLNNKFFDAIRRPCTEYNSSVPASVSTVILILASLSIKIF